MAKSEATVEELVSMIERGENLICLKCSGDMFGDRHFCPTMLY